MLALCKGPARNILLPGGSRSGKTFLIVYVLCLRSVLFPGSRHLICRKRFNAAKASIWKDTLRKVLSFFPSDSYRLNETDHIVEWVNGSEIWVDGLDEKERIDKILGREYASIFFNECSQIPWATIDLVMSRLAQKAGRIKLRAFFDLNPTGRGHWSYKIWIEGVDPVTGQPVRNPEAYAHLFSTADDNAENLNAEYISEVLDAMTGPRRRRFRLGQYSDDDGNLVFPLGPGTPYVWKDFEAWLGTVAAPDIKTTGGLDLGFEDADAFCLIVYAPTSPVRWLVHEAKARKQGLEALVKMIRDGLAFLDDHKLPRPDYIYTDSGGGGKRTMIDLAAVYGLPTAPAYKQDKESGILLLQQDLEKATLRIPADGIMHDEARKTVWIDDDETGIRAIDDAQFHPDLVDAVLYAMRYVWYYYTRG